MDLYSLIVAEFPELEITSESDPFKNGTVQLKDDGDGIQYIAIWNHTQSLPKSLAKFER
jgi:hypothetical protein